MFVTLFILGASKKMNADRSGDMIKKLMENTQPKTVAEENKAALYGLATGELGKLAATKLQGKIPGVEKLTDARSKMTDLSNTGDLSKLAEVTPK